MNATSAVRRLRVMEGDAQAVSLAGMHLLGELADRLGLSSAYSDAVPFGGERAPLVPPRPRGTLLLVGLTSCVVAHRHDRGRSVLAWPNSKESATAGVVLELLSCQRVPVLAFTPTVSVPLASQSPTTG